MLKTNIIVTLYRLGRRMRYWIISITEENWYMVKKSSVYGAPESQRFKGPADLIKPGDVLIFYVKKTGSKRFGGKFVGAFKVTSTWYKEDKPLWPDEVREGKVKYPWRARLEPIKLGLADFEKLVPELTFIVKKERATAYLVGTPANLRRPIPDEDAQIIINALR